MRLLLFCATAVIASAQSFSVGLKGGVRLTDDVEGNLNPESKRYVVGPSVEVGLPFRLAVEVDALYRRFGYSTVTTDLLGSLYFGRVRANSWEFPILAKYRSPAHIYAVGGIAPRHVSGSEHISAWERDFYTGDIVRHSDSTVKSIYPTTVGVVVGGGVEIRKGHVSFSPEFRYTRWLNRSIERYYHAIPDILSASNQCDVLVSIAWAR